tara:strand:- start:2113 stop:2580 length:468 start_codon:yes stop_codon:yes gene_type:complete
MIKLLSFFFLLVHPVYISTSEITINQNKAILKIKIFRDDLEDGLRMYHNKSISIDSQLKLVNESKYVDEYIMNKFILSINDDIIKLSSSEFKLENDVVEISNIFQYKKKIRELNIINSILFEIYKIQKNVIFINNDGKSDFYTFSQSDKEKTFNY